MLSSRSLSMPHSVAGILTLAFVAFGPDVLRAADPIDGVGPKGPVREVYRRCIFTEGPVAMEDGSLLFTDIPKQLILKVDPQGDVTTFREESNFANGLMFNSQGELCACEMAVQVVAISPEDGKRRVIADEYQGKRFNAPNDLVVDSAGGIYFTDPGFRAPDPLPQGATCVYYVAADGEVSRLVDDLPNPNGVILSPDEKTLYVIPTGQAEMMSYPVTAPGKIGEGKVFCRLKQAEGQSGKGGDGLTIDSKGNLYVTSGLGIQVFSPEGDFLGIIEFPKQPANVTFGGPNNQTLFVTARSTVYAVDMDASGLDK